MEDGFAPLKRYRLFKRRCLNAANSAADGRKGLVMTCTDGRRIDVDGAWDIVARTLALSRDGAIFGVVEVRRDDPADLTLIKQRLARQSRTISSLRLALARATQKTGFAST